MSTARDRRRARRWCVTLLLVAIAGWRATAQEFALPSAPGSKALLDAGVKFYASLGNHDSPDNRLYPLFNMGGERYYSFSTGNVRFFVLDSDQIDRKQLAWIEDALKSSHDDWKICYFHHPLYSNGGTHGPSVAFLQRVGEPMLVSGWVVACAIDVPGTYVIARLLFGRYPAVPFLLLLAIAADAIGLAWLAVLRPIGDVHPALGVGLMAAAVGSAAVFRRRGIKSVWLYLVGPGALSWCALFLSGIHPALALVPIIPFFPHAKSDAGLFVDPGPETHDTLTLFARWWRLPVQGVLLVFGLVNAGVPLHGLEPGMWAVSIAALGRPVGILAASAVGLAFGLHVPHRVGWRELTVIGCTASVGLVFALFFASTVMPPGPLLLEMKMGALLTVAGGGLAFAVAHRLRVGRFARDDRGAHGGD